MTVIAYLRKSTDEQADSLATQHTNAGAWCAAKSWTIASTFEDSGISRTEFAREKRRGWYAMLDAATRAAEDNARRPPEQREPFVVVVRDPSRIGGSIARAMLLVEDLLATGARLFTYIDGREITATNAMECVTLALQFFGAANEVEGIRSRTREALFTKARAGRVAGGAVYGYRNQPSAELVRDRRGNLKPAYVERVIDPVQAKWVVFIFEKYNNGLGYSAIAKALNLRGVPPPRAGRGGRPAWTQSAIHAIVRHDIYRGRVIYGVHKKTYVAGTKVRVKTPESEHVVVDAPELVIVSPELWASTRTRMGTATRPRTKRAKTGRPASNLLTGILRCGVCGSSMKVVNTKLGRENVSAYMCTTFDGKRPVPELPGGFCTNTFRRPIAEVNENIIGWLEEELVREDIVTDALEEARRRIQETVAKRRDETPELRARVERLRAERTKLLGLALGAPDKSTEAFYHSEIASRTTELEDLEGRLHAVDVAPKQVDLEIRRMTAAATKRVQAIRDILSGEDVLAGRALVEQFFPDGIRADPVVLSNETGKGRRTAKRFALSADAAGDWPLLVVGDGLEVDPSKVASPAGFSRDVRPNGRRIAALVLCHVDDLAAA